MAFRPVTHYLAALLVLLVVCCCGTASAAATDAQQNITYSFLSSFAYKFKKQLGSSWTGLNYCSWSGITCDGDGYVTIRLPGVGLDGYLPDLNGYDTLITGIDLSNNPKIDGNFPNSWAGLKALREMSLSSTGLYGQIPDAWNGMISLEKVVITNTGACYGLPNWSNMSSLTTIDFSSNNMGGRLVSSWANLTSLSSVRLTGNGFCDCEPESWKTVSVLHNAVSSLAVASSTCGTSNICSPSNFNCKKKNGSGSTESNGTVGLVSTAVAVLSVACALLSVVAL